MPRINHKTPVFIKITEALLLFAFMTTIYCSNKTLNHERLTIAVSILPLAEFVEKIGGDRVSVMTMVGPGASPHSYEPSPQQLQQISEADIYVKLGAPIEFELVLLDKLLALNSKLLLIDASNGIKLRSTDADNHKGMNGHEHKNHIDPHTWLSVRNSMVMIENIYNGLCRVDSAYKNYYFKNYQQYRNELERLDQELISILSDSKDHRFMVYHPSWGYFCNDYGLDQIAVEIEGKEPSAQDMKKLIEQAKKENIKIIFASPQFSLKGAEVIAREIDGHVVLIDPLAKNYIDNIKKIGRVFVGSMQ